MRYHGQGGEVPVAWVDDAARRRGGLRRGASGALGFTLDARDRAGDAAGRSDRPHAAAAQAVARKGQGATPRGQVPVHLASGTTEVPLFDRDSLGAGDRIAGPAIVAQLDATTLLLPGWSGEVHASGAILLTYRKPS